MAVTPAAATARNIGTKIAYRTPRSRAPVIATASSTAAGTRTYGAAARNRGSAIAAMRAAHRTSIPSGVFTSSAA